MEFSRRKVLAGFAAANSLSYSPDNEIAKEVDEEDLRFDEGFLERFGHTVWGNSRFPWMALEIVSGFARTDANRYGDVLEKVWNELGKDRAASFMNYCPDHATISVPGEDLNARFDGLGRVSGLMVDGSEQVPFKMLREVDEEDGIYAGLSSDGEERWLPFDASVERSSPAPGIARYEYGLDELEVVQDAQIESGNLVLDYRVENNGQEKFEGEFLTHARVNANRNFQNPIVFESEVNSLGVEDDELLSFISEDSDAEIEVFLEGSQESSRDYEEPDEWLDEEGYQLLKKVVNRLMGDEDTDSEGSMDREEAVEEGLDLLNARYLSGVLEKPLEVHPGESSSFTVEIDVGKEGGYSASRGDRLVQNLLGYVRSDGGISASHNLQPMYYPAWIRDGAFVAETLAEEGHEWVAEDFYNEFLPEVQREEGGFYQCYHVDGSETGTWFSEIDQPAIVASKYPELKYEEFGDENVSINMDVEADEMYAETLLRLMEKEENGMMAGSPDFAEQPGDFFKKSLWTHAWAAEAFQKASDINESLSLSAGSPEILQENAEDGSFSFQDYNFGEVAERIEDRISEEFLEYNVITNYGESGARENLGGIYGKIITDTDVLSEEEEDRLLDEMKENIEPSSFWSFGLAAYGNALEYKGYHEKAGVIKQTLEDSITEMGHLPERMKQGSREDASELAMGVAEAVKLLE